MVFDDTYLPPFPVEKKRCKMKTPWLIIDIETLGETYNSAIFAVAMLNSDGEQYKFKLDILPQIKAGADVTQEAFEFWLHQPAAHWYEDYQLISPTKLKKFIHLIYNDGEVWCKGKDFDIPNIGNLLVRNGGERASKGWEPWDYWDLHCVRDAQMITGKNPDARRSHDPIEDCKDCVWVIEEHHRVQGILAEIHKERPGYEKQTAKDVANVIIAACKAEREEAEKSA